MDDKKKEKIVYKCVKESFSILYNYSKSYILINIAVISISGLIPSILILIMQRMLNLIQSGTNHFQDILSYALLYILVNIANCIMQFCFSYYNTNFNLTFTQHIDMIMLKKASNLSLRDFEDASTYDVINRAQNQNGKTILVFTTQIADILRQSISIGSTAIILFGLKWWIFVAITIVPLIRCIASYVIDKQWYDLRIARTQEERQKWYVNFLLMTGNAFKEIKILGISNFLIKKYQKITDKIINEEQYMNKKKTRYLLVFELFDWIITGIIYTFTLYMGFSGQILIGDITAYIQCINTVKNSTQSTFSGISTIIDQSLYINLLYLYLKLPEKHTPNGIEISQITKIEFRNVSFKYTPEKYALKNINMIIAPEENIAIVGENGSGKTTLIKLLLGLYDNYEGDILINDIELRKINLNEYHKKLSCVFQDYMKFQTSIRENVAFGNLKHIANNELIWAKLNDVGLGKRVEHINGIDAIIGNWFSKENFSIGEWQRLAISRAFLSESDVLFLDEPDASLDILKQNELLDLYKKSMQHRISIYVSHKICHIHQLSDRIYLLSNGELIEKGTHRELLAKKGLYYKYFVEYSKEMNSASD